MTTGDELPAVVPSAVDPEVDCVLVDPEAARAAGSGEPAGANQPLCPPGYVPRQRPRAPYHLHGKVVITTEAPTQNPEPPPVH